MSGSRGLILFLIGTLSLVGCGKDKENSCSPNAEVYIRGEQLYKRTASFSGVDYLEKAKSEYGGNIYSMIMTIDVFNDDEGPMSLDTDGNLFEELEQIEVSLATSTVSLIGKGSADLRTISPSTEYRTSRLDPMLGAKNYEIVLTDADRAEISVNLTKGASEVKFCSTEVKSALLGGKPDKSSIVMEVTSQVFIPGR